MKFDQDLYKNHSTLGPLCLWQCYFNAGEDRGNKPAKGKHLNIHMLPPLVGHHDSELHSLFTRRNFLRSKSNEKNEEWWFVGGDSV